MPNGIFTPGKGSLLDLAKKEVETLTSDSETPAPGHGTVGVDVGVDGITAKAEVAVSDKVTIGAWAKRQWNKAWGAAAKVGIKW